MQNENTVDTDKKISILLDWFGGLDWALLFFAAHRVLGDKAVGILGISPSLPESERRGAQAFAAGHGLRLLTVQTDEMSNPEYTRNPDNRCYFCKSEFRY